MLDEEAQVTGSRERDGRKTEDCLKTEDRGRRTECRCPPPSVLGPLSSALRSRSVAVYAVVSFAALYLGYAWNLWRAVDFRLYTDRRCAFMEAPEILGPDPLPDDLLTFDRYSEGLVIGRLIANRTRGFFWQGGFVGRFTDLPVSAEGVKPQLFASGYQYKLYLDPPPDYQPEGYGMYQSHIGGQALFTGVLDAVLPLDNGTKLRVFYHVMAALTALAFVLITLWFYAEFGAFTGWFLTVAFCLLSLPTLYARNLWWVIWAFYIPFVVMVYLYRREASGSGPLSLRRLFLLMLAAMLVKLFFNGCEYITTAVVMALVPQCYYAIRDRWLPGRFLSRAGISAVACVLAIGLFFVALSFQYVLAGETFMDGVRHIGERFLVRTRGGQEVLEELGGREPLSLFALLRWYFTVPVVLDLRKMGLDQVFGMKWVIVLYLSVTVGWAVTWRRWRSADRKARMTALLVTLWLSALAPCSWFVIFKGHSDVHRTLAGIIWYMPFMFYGVALLGVSLQTLIGCRWERSIERDDRVGACGGE